MTLTGNAPAPACAGPVDDDPLEEAWRSSPNLSTLEELAGHAAQGSPGVQRKWSARLRQAGLWSLCPLLACARDGSLPLGRRATAAATAWDLDRDRQGRAILRCLLPGLAPEEAGAILAQMSPEALADLEKGPFVWSVVPFFNELDLLAARLEEMARAVDRFVIIEAPVTFRGEPKPLYYQENRSRFRNWSTQVDHCVVSLPDSPDPWDREIFQRNVGREVLADLGAKGDDVVLLTDLDEIVRADKVPGIVTATETGPVILLMSMYWYSPAWRDPVPWAHPKAFRYGQVPPCTTYHQVRHQSLPVVADAGWHLSFFGGRAQFDYKISSFSHSEDDTPEKHSAGYQDMIFSQGIATHGRKLLPAHDYFPYSLRCLFHDQEPDGQAPGKADGQLERGEGQ